MLHTLLWLKTCSLTCTCMASEAVAVPVRSCHVRAVESGPWLSAEGYLLTYLWTSVSSHMIWHMRHGQIQLTATR